MRYLFNLICILSALIGFSQVQHLKIDDDFTKDELNSYACIVNAENKNEALIKFNNVEFTVLNDRDFFYFDFNSIKLKAHFASPLGGILFCIDLSPKFFRIEMSDLYLYMTHVSHKTS